jgi:hypothetical protein
MRGFAAVFAREIAERRLVAAAALVLGLLPLAMPLLPASAHQVPAELRGATALLIAALLAPLLALALGTSVVARDLGERRLGFYFARPLAGWAIWAGKFAAAAVLALGSSLLVVLPALLLGDRLDASGYWGQGPFAMGWRAGAGAIVLAWAGAVLLLLLLAHAFAIVVRAHSPWLVADLAALAVVAALFRASRRLLVIEAAFASYRELTLALFLAALVALAAAGAVQVTRGRTDLRRGHRLLSLALWGLLLTASAAALAWARWRVAVAPTDLLRVEETTSPAAGSWLHLCGPAPHHDGLTPCFLLDTASRRYVRTRLNTGFPDRLWGGQLVFSADGRWATWVESDPDGGSERVALEIGRPGSRPLRTPYAGPFPAGIALSPDGSKIATEHDRRLVVEETATGRLLASQPLPGTGYSQDRMAFTDASHLRLYQLRYSPEPASQLDIFELDLAAGSLAHLARTRGADSLWTWRLSPDRTRILLGGSMRRDQERRIDARTGEPIAVLSLPAGRQAGAAFLADGRIAASSRGPAGRELRIFAAGGAVERTFHFANARVLALGGQPLPHTLVVGVAPTDSRPVRDWTALLLDLESGAVRQLGRGLEPLGGPDAGPASAAAHLFFRRGDGVLLSLDPATGRRTVVLRNR